MDDLNVVSALEKHVETGKRLLSPLFPCVNRPVDFSFGDWLMLFSLTMEFKPQMIIEVGRGFGNSTCVFLETANQLNCPLLSFDLSGKSWQVTAKRVRAQGARGPEWFSRGTIIAKDFTRVHPEKTVPDGVGRTLFFWDAHGKALGDYIIPRIFPRLRARPHLIIVHDITDLRGGGLGQNPQYLLQGTFNTPFEEIFPLYELWQAEKTAIGSPAYDITTAMSKDPERIGRLTNIFPESSRPILGRAGHWVYFQLSGTPSARPEDVPTPRAQDKALGSLFQRIVHHFTRHRKARRTAGYR